MSYNRISYGRTPNNIPFINGNIKVLNQFSQLNGFVYFNGKRIGQSLSVSSYNQQSEYSNESNSSYNIQFNNIQNIVFEGATVIQNPYNQNQVIVKIENIKDYISSNQQNIVVNNNFYQLKQINVKQYNSSVGQYLICNSQREVSKGKQIIRLPSDPSDMSYVKIATLDKINSDNVVSIVVNSANTYINSTNETQLIIDSAYSSVQLIFSQITRTWLVVTPFIPRQRQTIGLTEQDAIQMAKKQMLIFS